MARFRVREMWLAVAVAAACSACAPSAVAQRNSPDADAREKAALKALVEADWTAQEKRRGREPHAPPAIRDALRRAGLLLDALGNMPGAADLRPEAEQLEQLRRQVEQTASLDEPARLELYRRVRAVGRQVALKNPLLAGRPIVFVKQRRFVFQMLHEYLGYYYDYGNLSGGGVCVLEEPGRSLRARDLVGGRLPRGSYTTLGLSYDAKTVYFALADVQELERERPSFAHWKLLPPATRVAEPQSFFSPQRRCFHIFSVNADGSELRQLTHGQEDDFDPCPLPDGGVAFMSTRRGGYCRCGGQTEPVPTYTLHRMERDGSGLRTLSFHETNEWHPSVLSDGRIVYSRWDYVDRSAAHFHGLWVCNPDGGNPSLLFGNYTKRISACYQPRAIPGSQRILFVAGAHHTPVGGSLVILDPRRVKRDPESGEDQFDCLELLTPEVCFPEAPGWPQSYFHSPWPLSENYFLVAFSYGPLPGWGSQLTAETPTGLYYFDRFGNLELLYREPGLCAMSPIPLAPRPAPPVTADVLEPKLGDEGEFVLADVRWSQSPLPQGRPVRELRVFQVLPKTTYVVNQPRIGYANGESARLLLGTVPVEADGSAYFRAPARKALYFQAVDAGGRAVQSMRSVTYLQPGERRGCVGCHEPPGTAPPSRQPLALGRGPSILKPGPDGTRPLSYPRLVQPVLDRHCVACHDGGSGPGKAAPDLTGPPERLFTRSYENLRPYVRWFEWGEQSIADIVTEPGRIGADASPLSRILDDATHAKHVRLPEEDRRRLYLWLDANAPFYGTYSAEEQRAQRDGRAVPPPRVQ